MKIWETLDYLDQHKWGYLKILTSHQNNLSFNYDTFGVEQKLITLLLFFLKLKNYFSLGPDSRPWPSYNIEVCVCVYVCVCVSVSGSPTNKVHPKFLSNDKSNHG